MLIFIEPNHKKGKEWKKKVAIINKQTQCENRNEQREKN